MAPLGFAADMAGESTDHQQAILGLFATLPGDKAVRIFAPAAKGKPAFSVEMNAERQFFVGSAVKNLHSGGSPAASRHAGCGADFADKTVSAGRKRMEPR